MIFDWFKDKTVDLRQPDTQLIQSLQGPAIVETPVSAFVPNQYPPMMGGGYLATGTAQWIGQSMYSGNMPATASAYFFEPHTHVPRPIERK